MSREAEVVVIGEKEPGQVEVRVSNNSDTSQELLDQVQELARVPIPGEYGYVAYVWSKGGDPYEQVRREAEGRAG